MYNCLMDLRTTQNLALSLMAEHGLTNWGFRFDTSRRRFGRCVYGSRQRITLSKHMVLVNDEPAVRNVILHEIAHALLPYEVKHGPEWVAKARSIGCDGIECYDGIGAAHTVVRPIARVIGTCPNCGKTHRRTYIPHTRLPACKTCCVRFAGGRFDSRFTLVYTMNRAA
jgi:hypothetical protein